MVSLQELKINKRKKNNNYWVSLQVVASRRFFLFWCVFQFNLVQINNDYCTLSWPCREITKQSSKYQEGLLQLKLKWKIKLKTKKKKKWANVINKRHRSMRDNEGRTT